MERRFNSLKELREAYRMSLADVGKAIGLTAATIWQWEQKGNAWLWSKARHISLLEHVFDPKDVAEALDPDWTPPPAEPEPEQKPEVVVAAKWMSSSGETTPADVISELMAVLAQLNLKEMTAVLNTAKLILAAKNNAKSAEQ